MNKRQLIIFNIFSFKFSLEKNKGKCSEIIHTYECNTKETTLELYYNILNSIEIEVVCEY